MNGAELAAWFFQRRWPNGFECPTCGHGSYYVISTRKLPLYQCRLCHRQTTVTAGTVMHRSRTPLEKWAAAIELLSSSDGVNAEQLAAGIGVSHKTAWLMLRKLRHAVGEAEASRKLYGTVHTGLLTLAPRYLFLFLPEVHFRKERVVFVGASIGPSGEPSSLKIGLVPSSDLVQGTKELTQEGKAEWLAGTAAPNAKAAWLNSVRMYQSPLNRCLKEAKGWMNWLFNGIGTRNLQSYLNEYCFRWNVAASGLSPRESWWNVCFPDPTSIRQAAA